MDFLKRFSLRRIAELFGQSFKRFPIAMLLTLLLTCFFIYNTHCGNVRDKLEFFLTFYPATGALLAISLSLLTEDFKNKVKALLTQVTVHLLWLGVSVYLAQCDRFSLAQGIAVAATVFAIGISIFLICFYHKGQDIPFWNFSIRTVLSLGISAAIGGMLTMGLYALMESLKLLFNMDLSNHVYPDIAAVCMVALAPALFMNLIPKGENKYRDDVPEFSRFAKGVVQYLFLPLLGLYLITLYAYAIKILAQWSLPVGGVSYLVSGSMVLMVLLIYITYPIQHLEGNALFKRVTRWLPVLMFPLLALMTVAIWKRLSDYGITVSRLYLLVFNLWCYAVCLWLIFTRNKRIWLIPASFAAILFLISVGPQSIANITQYQLLKEARAAFSASGITQLPLTGEQYEQWLNSTSPTVAKAIDSKLYYLQTDFGYNTTKGLIAMDAETGNLAINGYEEKNVSSYNNFLINENTVPQGYSQMSLEDLSCEGYLKDGDDVVIEIRHNHVRGAVDGVQQRDPVTHQFKISSKRLIELDSDRNPDGNVEPLVIDNGKELLMIHQYNLNIENNKKYYLSAMGIMFTK